MKKCFILVVLFLVTLVSCVDGGTKEEEIKKYQLPNLSGYTYNKVISIFSDLNIENYTINYVYSVDNEPLSFLSYLDYNSGDFVPKNITITINIAYKNLELPNLIGKTEEECILLLSQFKDVNILYENTKGIDETFYSYGNGRKQGDTVSCLDTINLFISKIKFTLPNLDNLTLSEALPLFSGYKGGVKINYIDSTNLEDDIFISYPNGLVQSTIISNSTEQLNLYFSKHAYVLPDFTDYNKEEIIEYLEEDNVRFNYIFEYVETITQNKDYFVDYQLKLKGDYIRDTDTLIINISMPKIIPTEGLMISKYIEGILYDKAIELYNYSQSEIDLSTFSLRFYLDGSETSETFLNLTGTIFPNETFLIVNPNATIQLFNNANMLSSTLTFNGDDSIALVYNENSEIVDVIGKIGFGLMSLNDRTLVRKEITRTPNYYSLDWYQYYYGYYDIIGVFPVVYPETFTYDPKYLDIPFSEKGGMVQVTYISNNDGDTAQFEPGFTGANRVRFIGIDTNETGTGDLANNATLFCRSILTASQETYLQYDPESGNRESYGRTLALVWCDGVLLNYLLVYYGHTQNNYHDSKHSLVFNGVSLTQWFYNAELHARENKLGVYA